MYKTLLACALGFASANVYAFHIEDHERVMRQAVSEFVACHPEFQQALNADWLAKGDRDEDLNLVEKELYFSHFYHPGKHLPLMWRGDSAARLVNLAPSLLQCKADQEHMTYNETMDLGHAIHHLQDMAVPAHVVPVMHSFWDAFESFEVDGDIASGWDCQTLDRSAAPLETVLEETAMETLNTIQNFKFTVKRGFDGSELTKTGSDFWLEGEGDAFGQYGSLGNNFGQANFDAYDMSYSVLPSVYLDFKREQLRAAVRSSLRALSFQMLN